jgi:CHASE2 domain-containing sensor protein
MFAPALRMRTRRLYKLLLIGAGVASLALVLTGYGFNVLKRADLTTVDARFSIRGTQSPPANLAIVKIDDVTFSDMPRLRFPFSRTLHAKVIDRIAADRPKAIA